MNQFEREVQARTGLSGGAVRAATKLAVELSACTCMSPSETWRIVSRFLESFAASYKIRRINGLDVTAELIEVAVAPVVDVAAEGSNND